MATPADTRCLLAEILKISVSAAQGLLHDAKKLPSKDAMAGYLFLLSKTLLEEGTISSVWDDGQMNKAAMLLKPVCGILQPDSAEHRFLKRVAMKLLGSKGLTDIAAHVLQEARNVEMTQQDMMEIVANDKIVFGVLAPSGSKYGHGGYVFQGNQNVNCVLLHPVLYNASRWQTEIMRGATIMHELIHALGRMDQMERTPATPPMYHGDKSTPERTKLMKAYGATEDVGEAGIAFQYALVGGALGIDGRSFVLTLTSFVPDQDDAQFEVIQSLGDERLKLLREALQISESAQTQKPTQRRKQGNVTSEAADTDTEERGTASSSIQTPRREGGNPTSEAVTNKRQRTETGIAEKGGFEEIGKCSVHDQDMLVQ